MHGNGSQLALALGGLIFVAGCQHLGLQHGNVLTNPGFEVGREGWSWLDTSAVWSDFTIVDEPVRSGKGAAHLSLRQAAEDPLRRVGIYGVVQEILPEIVPERVGGWFRVDRWENSDPDAELYLQLVAMVWGDPRAPEIVSPRRPSRGLKNYQIRYYLAGAERPAFRLLNAQILHVSREPPKLGKWVHFEVRLREDLMRYWSEFPRDHEYIRLLFEARWDNLSPGARIAADVTFDDLYAL